MNTDLAASYRSAQLTLTGFYAPDASWIRGLDHARTESVRLAGLYHARQIGLATLTARFDPMSGMWIER